ncbi:hypothetical protein HPB49_000831 [Dermacentor silvarum]|uniref:Uncharacterized protein n=1 Tax=Dermacentor silvarum TaxID=543639 RepID=A0ACB8DSS1_DERSI|nr:hypothetical protein HPB49_000831 [Dermacentor silvarum]
MWTAHSLFLEGGYYGFTPKTLVSHYATVGGRPKSAERRDFRDAVIVVSSQRQLSARAHWVRPVWRNRAEESEYFTAMRLMKTGDPTLFYKYYRMTPETFEKLHSLVDDHLTKQWLCRKPISSGERLAMCLRYLASGMSIPDVAMAFRVGIETAREAIHSTSRVLWEVLSPLYMQRTYSVVLMAVVDSQYLFRLIDVGAPGRLSDGGIFKDSPIGKRLEKGELGFPRAAQLPASSKSSPHVFIGDEAFQLRPDFMRPLPGSRTEPKDIVFNYRLSRAR